MSEAQQLNEVLSFTLQDTTCMNEMATIEKVIIVHNDREVGQVADNFKFAHFHFANLHFKFRRECPKNLLELKEMIAFPYELKRVKETELKKLLKLLNSKPTKKTRVVVDNIYDYTIFVWEALNDREVDYIN